MTTSPGVYSRGVRTTAAPAITIMWKTMHVPRGVCDFRPYHLVVLHHTQDHITEDLIGEGDHSAAEEDSFTVLPDLTPDATPLNTPPPRREDDHSTPQDSTTIPSDLTPDVSPENTSPPRSEDEFQNSQL